MNSKYIKGKVSVIIPCYNQGRFVDDAVNSVLNQTYQNFEIIIINDGSTDKFTIDLLKNFKRPKTKVYTTTNQGLASTRNYGFSLSKGEFIQFLDADDFLNPKKFEEQISSFSKDSELGVSYTNCQYYYDDKKEYSEALIKESLTKDPFEDFVYRWQRGISIPVHCALFKRKIWDKDRPFVQGFGAIEDWLMWVYLAKREVRFNFLDRDYAYYRIQSNNMTKNLSFMIYWVSRAISYIAEHYIEEKDLKKYNLEQQKYLKNLIDLYFLDRQKKEYQEKFEQQEKEMVLKDKEINIIKSDLHKTKIEINEIKKSKSYRIGQLVAWLPREIIKILREKRI